MTSKNSKQPKVLVLDFDGVVILSNEIKDEAFESIFARRFADYPDRQSEIRAYHFSSNIATRRQKFEHIVYTILGLPDRVGWVDELVAEFEELTRARLVRCEEGRGATAFLEYWSRQAPIYLLSATPQVDLDLVVNARGYQGFFKRVIGAGKPKADSITEILASEKVSVSDLLFVGDSPEDLTSARKAGVPFAGIHGRTRFEGETRDGRAVPSFPDLASLNEWLQS